ncbi:MAG: ATP-binding cassette domain-containing protein [bacterium]
MIQVKNITKKFGSLTAVDNISFEINPGEVVGFLGPNGAGKTTTLRMITGFLTPTCGSVFINNKETHKSPLETKKSIGYLPESSTLYSDMVVIDFLCFMGRMRRMTKKELLNRLPEVISQCRINSVLEQGIGTLSKGYKQRVGLAQALLHDPDILILDEPTVGLDPNQIVEIRELIKEIGQIKTVLLSSHILPEVVSTCSRLLVINKGKLIAQGSPATLMQTALKNNNYHVTLRGPLEAIRQKLTQTRHITRLDVLGSEKDLHDLYLTYSGDQNKAEDIFRIAAEHKWSLAKLVRETASLEDVFKDLTKQ